MNDQCQHERQTLGDLSSPLTPPEMAARVIFCADPGCQAGLPDTCVMGFLSDGVGGLRKWGSETQMAAIAGPLTIHRTKTADGWKWKTD